MGEEQPSFKAPLNACYGFVYSDKNEPKVAASTRPVYTAGKVLANAAWINDVMMSQKQAVSHHGNI